MLGGKSKIKKQIEKIQSKNQKAPRAQKEPK
jgi:hypothetical protein